MSAIFSVDKYPNLLKFIALTSDDIKNQIEGYKLSFLSVRNPNVEWKIKFPSFVRAFYGFIYKENHIPTQQQYFSYYLSLNKDYFDTNQFTEEIITGLKARVFRTYPSLVRDVFFNKFLQEKLPDYTVIYNMDLDMENDIDILITKDNHHWALSLFTKTKRGYDGREAKTSRHTLFDNVTYVDLPIDLRECDKVGDFMLYGENEFEQIKSKIS